MSKKKKTEHFANVQYLFDHFILQMRNINVVIYAGHIDEYCSAWNRETGFFEKGVGCKLDRRLRSSICLSYVCDEVRKTMTELELAVLRLMHNVR
jgi:hypothetical protein